MRKLILIATLFALSGAAYADIQAPPGSHYTPVRKLGRAVGNILYGAIEIPEQFFRKTNGYGGSSYGIINGGYRTVKRFGYGFYELFTFYCPTYHGTFKPPYQKCGQDWRIEMNPHEGLSEFPPELGFETYFSHSRSQNF
ncbi:MAG: exosortase system-associated protein, TIGR04073 family [Roseibacillus sp.]